MRVLLTAVVGFAAVGLAQVGLNDLPNCAQGCVGDSLASTGCDVIDVECICNSRSWIAQLSCCVSQDCEPDDQESTIEFAEAICEPYGVSIPQTASCAPGQSTSATAASSSSTGSSGTSSSSATSTSDSSASSSSSASETSEGSSATPTSDSSTSSSSSASETSEGSPATAESTTTSTETPGAAPTAGVGLGAAVIAVLAAL